MWHRIAASVAGVSWRRVMYWTLFAGALILAGVTYQKGYSTAEQKYLGEVSDALERQLKRQKVLAARDMTAALALYEEEVRVVSEINQVAPAVGGLCSADGVRAYRETVRIANGYTARAEAPAARADRTAQ